VAFRSKRRRPGALSSPPAQSSSPDAWFRAAWNADLEIRPYPDSTERCTLHITNRAEVVKQLKLTEEELCLPPSLLSSSLWAPV